MNEHLHNILDGELSDENRTKLFHSQQDAEEFQEHQVLQEALRQNADHDGLSSTEKSQIGAGLIATLGLDALPPSLTSPSSNWLLKGVSILTLGILIGAGGFALFDVDPPVPPQTVGVSLNSTTPTFFPFTVPEPSAGIACDSLVLQLQDSIRRMQAEVNPHSSKRRRSSGKRKWKPAEPPVAGEPPVK